MSIGSVAPQQQTLMPVNAQTSAGASPMAPTSSADATAAQTSSPVINNNIYNSPSQFIPAQQSQTPAQVVYAQQAAPQQVQQAPAKKAKHHHKHKKPKGKPGKQNDILGKIMGMLKKFLGGGAGASAQPAQAQMVAGSPPCPPQAQPCPPQGPPQCKCSPMETQTQSVYQPAPQQASAMPAIQYVQAGPPPGVQSSHPIVDGKIKADGAVKVSGPVRLSSIDADGAVSLSGGAYANKIEADGAVSIGHGSGAGSIDADGPVSYAA